MTTATTIPDAARCPTTTRSSPRAARPWTAGPRLPVRGGRGDDAAGRDGHRVRGRRPGRRADAVGTVTRAMLAGLPLLLAVVAGVTWLVTRRALRPVEAVRAELAEITASGDLARRVPVPDARDEIAASPRRRTRRSRHWRSRWRGSAGSSRTPRTSCAARSRRCARSWRWRPRIRSCWTWTVSSRTSCGSSISPPTCCSSPASTPGTVRGPSRGVRAARPGRTGAPRAVRPDRGAGVDRSRPAGHGGMARLARVVNACSTTPSGTRTGPSGCRCARRRAWRCCGSPTTGRACRRRPRADLRAVRAAGRRAQPGRGRRRARPRHRPGPGAGARREPRGRRGPGGGALFEVRLPAT